MYPRCGIVLQGHLFGEVDQIVEVAALVQLYTVFVPFMPSRGKLASAVYDVLESIDNSQDASRDVE